MIPNTISLPSYIHILYFGTGASALAGNLSPANTIRQSPTAISRKDVLRDPTFTLHSQTTSTDDYPHVVLQSATDIARPSRLLTQKFGDGPIRRAYRAAVIFLKWIASFSPNIRAPRSGIDRIAFYHAGVISSQLPGGTTGPSLPVTTSFTTNSTNSTTGLGHITVAIDHTASEFEHFATLLGGSTETMSDSRPQEEPENALSVLLSALPVDVASSIEAGFRVVTHDLLATSNAETPRPTSLPPPSRSVDQITTSTSRADRKPTSSNESEQPTSRYTARPISDTSASQSTRRPDKSHISSSDTSRPTSRPTTLTTRPSTTPTPTITPTPSTTSSSTSSTSNSVTSAINAQDSKTAKTTAPPSITPEKQNTNGTIAGIATGSAAALVLLTLIVFFLLRRRRKQKALKALAAQKKQPYPEVAFLYDPVQSPPRSRSPAPLLGEAESNGGVGGGVVGSRRESAMTQAQRSSLLAPEVVVVPEGEHLLAPGRAASRESSPSGVGWAR